MDISCAKCDEPWDSDKILNCHNMTRAEAKLFMVGQGCPACKSSRKPGEFPFAEEFMESCLEAIAEDDEQMDRLFRDEGKPE